MRRALQFALLLAAVSCVAGDRIDGIVATVNNVPILQSDVDDAVRYETFVSGRAPHPITATDERAALERLIDQELLRQQMGKAVIHATADEVSARLERLRAQLPGLQSDAAWRQALDRYRLSESDLRDRLATEIEIMRFVDARLGVQSRVDSASVEAYYRDIFLPELKKAGAPAVPLADVQERIEEILRQQRVDQLLSSWLRDLRERSRISIMSEQPAKDAAAKAK